MVEGTGLSTVATDTVSNNLTMPTYAWVRPENAAADRGQVKILPGSDEPIDILQNDQNKFALLTLTVNGDPSLTFSIAHAGSPNIYAPSHLSMSPIYNSLTGRQHFIEHQPQPLDDITGDGLPNLVILESSPGGTAPGSPQYWITVLTLRGHAVEIHPAIHGAGEVFFFDDLDGDGRLELILGELDYASLHNERQIPPDELVWVFDPQLRAYRNAARRPEHETVGSP